MQPAASATIAAATAPGFRARVETARIALLALVLACGVAACFFYTFNHDAAYILYNAGQLRHG